MSITDPRPKQMLPYVICVEGNIGSGKSTLLTNLSESGFTVIEEPVTEIWGQYLPQLYDDIKRWGFCFQMEAMDWFRQLQSKKFAQILIRMKEQNGGYSINSTPKKTEREQTTNNNNGDSMMMGPCTSFENEQKQESMEPSEVSADSDDDDDDMNGTDLEDQENQSGRINAARNQTVNQIDTFSTPKKEKKNRRKSLSPQKQLLESRWLRQSKRVIIVERSALSCITIFAKNLMEQGNMTKWEYSLLKRFYSMIAWEPAHILYLRADPEICSRRILQRNRKGEGNVDPDLIRGLHEKHEIMFVRDGDDSLDSDVETQRMRDQEDGIYASPSQNIIIVNGHQEADAVLKEALRKISKIESRV